MSGDIVRIIRALYGITQTELARRIGVTNTHIAYIEKGKRTITKSIENRIIQEFQLTDVRIDELKELNRSYRKAIILGSLPLENDRS